MKRIAPISLVLLSLVALTGCSKQKEEYIAIVSAMDNEIDLLIRETELHRTEIIGPCSYHIGKLRDKNVIVLRSGIGKILAASAVTSLLNAYPVSRLVFTGIAGGVKEETQILDEVIATSLVEHDFGFVSDDGFTWGGGDPGKKEPGQIYYPDAKLTELAFESAKKVAGESHVYKGCVATGDQFVASSAYVERLRTEFDAYACEMEGAAVAKVCMNFDVPYAVLRVLSDKADGQAHENYERFAERAAEQSNKIVLDMLESI